MSGVASLVIKFVSHRKLRSFLTTLGIAIGVALVFSIVSINRGLVSSVSDTLNTFGDNFITVFPKMGGFGTGTSAFFTQKEVDAVKSLYFVKVASGGYASILPINIKGKDFFMTVRGGESKSIQDLFKEIQAYDFYKGRGIEKGERGVVVLGYDLAETYHLSPGSQIKIADKKFRIIGIMKRVGNRQQDNMITTNVEDLWEITGDTGKYFLIFIKMREMKTDELKRAIKRVRGREDFDLLTPENLAGQITQILRIINVVFLSVASISIFVGGVGVANTMYMAVAERTRDIGIMKAVGANKSDITKIFALESGILSVFGGFVGVLVGLLTSFAFGYFGRTSGFFTGFKFSFNLDLIVLTLVMSFVIGMVSGFFPARYASKLEPVKALRKEG